MGGGVEVSQPKRGMLHHHKHVEDSEPGGSYDAEITGDNQPGVIPEKDRPPLIAPRSTARRGRQLRHVLPDCARRHAQTELQQQLVCDPLLAPRGVLACNLSNHILKRGWDRSPTSFGLSAPEKAEALAVPGDQGLGPHHGQSISPIEPAAEQYQSQARRIVGTSRLDRALLIERQQLAQEQISAASEALERKTRHRKWTRSPRILNQLSLACMMQEALCRRRSLLRISKSYPGFKPEAKCFCGAQPSGLIFARQGPSETGHSVDGRQKE